MINYFLGIDAGATKSIARLTHQQRIVNEVRGGQASLSYDLNLAIANVQSLCVDLLNQSNLDAKDIVLACGAAAAGNPEATKQLEAALMQLGFAHVLITTDAQTSLIGAGDGKPLAMIAVGTGSVAMRLSRDGSVKQFGGWGLAVGDEGSGAAIGKSAVRSLLWELDIHGTPQTKLSRYVVERVGRERPAILRWLRQGGPLEYAELAPAVFDFLPHCELERKIAKKKILNTWNHETGDVLKLIHESHQRIESDLKDYEIQKQLFEYEKLFINDFLISEQNGLLTEIEFLAERKKILRQ